MSESQPTDPQPQEHDLSSDAQTKPAADASEPAVDGGGDTAAANNAETEYVEEDGPNFTPLQRQFLWTNTAVIALAAILAAGLNIGYQELQRSREMSLARAQDSYDTAKARLDDAKGRDMNMMQNAYVHNNQELFSQAMGDLMDALHQERTGWAELRREKGFVQEDVPDAYYQQIQDRIMSSLAATTRPAAAGTGQMGPAPAVNSPNSPATSQPTTAPATTSQALQK